MSYILEALKKSKEERLSEEAPHLHVVHRAPAVKTPVFDRRTKTVFAAILVVLLAICGLSYLVWLNKKPAGVEDSYSRITIGRLETRGNFFDQAGTTGVVVENSADTPRVTKLGSTRVKKVILGPSGEQQSAQPDRHSGLKYRQDLPLDVQKSLPELAFAGHTYADEPARRMIIVNNTIVREGDSIDADTKLVGIIWEGVVLDHKGLVYKQRTH